ncbi:MAG: hypothetical protein H6736_21680 [Alphaproteobacteria bacterium]|nr:hypothetical protein [Alphaproteobacteria bacterium]
MPWMMAVAHAIDPTLSAAVKERAQNSQLVVLVTTGDDGYQPAVVEEVLKGPGGIAQGDLVWLERSIGFGRRSRYLVFGASIETTPTPQQVVRWVRGDRDLSWVFRSTLAGDVYNYECPAHATVAAVDTGLLVTCTTTTFAGPSKSTEGDLQALETIAPSARRLIEQTGVPSSAPVPLSFGDLLVAARAAIDE